MSRLRLTKVCALTLLILIPWPVISQAHQPVNLTVANKSPESGPILVDGTTSFAIRANFSKQYQTQGFRAALKAGEELNFEYLIIDRPPENRLATNKLPVATIVDPQGGVVVIKFSERSKFFEPHTRTNYLYLARYRQVATDGIYRISLKSEAKSAITVAVGRKEISGDVLMPATCPAWARPSGEVRIERAYAEGLVGMKKDSAASCAANLGWQYRVGQKDDQIFTLTKDYRLDRVTVVIKKGVITQVDVG